MEISIQEMNRDAIALRARKFWRVDRKGWILDRALGIWLVYGEEIYWDPEDPRDIEEYELLHDKVRELPDDPAWEEEVYPWEGTA